MRTSAIFAVSLFALVGCGDNSGGPLSSVPSQVTNGPVGPASSTPYSRSEGDQSVSAAQQLSTGGGVHVAEARSSVGAPVIYSTTGGPLPDAKRAGHVQIGANVTPLPDWKRPDRWSDPVNGVSVSTGRTYDGARGTQIAEYVIPHIDDKWEPQGYANEPTTDTPGLATFPNQPVLRLAEGTSKEHSAYALHAAALINSTLPHNKRILIGPEAPPLASVDQIPDGQIFVDFAAKSDWIPSSEGSAMNATSYSWEWVPRQDSGCPFSDDCAWEWVPREDGILCPTPDDCAVAPGEAGRWKISGMRAGHVWVDPDAFHTQAEFVRVLVHEMLHALGLRGHSFVDRFPKSVLRNAYSTILPTDNHVPEIDADGLLAIYTRLAPGAEPETFSATGLEPWGNESQRMHGELNIPDGAAFGVAFRNDLGRPWAVGPEPFSSIAQNQDLRSNATWDGALLGFTPEGNPVAGEAEITVDLGALTGRADFTGLLESNLPKSQDDGSWSTWSDGDLGYTVVVNGNTIRETGGDEGLLTASFVGRRHQGTVGTLERQDLSAAFGASIAIDNLRDHSNTLDEATDITLGTRFTGSITSPTDVDYFKLPVSKVGTLTITTTGDANPNVRVFDAEGTEIPGSPGSYIVDITKAILAKGKHIFVQFSGGNTGQGYFASTALEEGAGEQELIREKNHAKRYSNKAIKAMQANAIHTSLYYGLFPPSPYQLLDLRKAGITLSDMANLILRGEWPKLEESTILEHLANAVFLGGEAAPTPLNEKIVNFQYRTNPTTQPVSISVSDFAEPITGTTATHYEVFGSWGRWNYHGISFEHSKFTGSNVSELNYTGIRHFYSESAGHSTGKLPEASASYTGEAHLWDSSKRLQANEARMQLIYTFDTKTVDVEFEYKLPDGQNLKYTAVNAYEGVGSNFSKLTDKGQISGSFYGPDRQEVGGVFQYFHEGKTPSSIGGLHTTAPDSFPASAGTPHAPHIISGAFSAARD